MGTIILILSLLLSIVLGVALPKNRQITALLFVVAWILMCLNTENPDYAGYEARYYAFSQKWVSDITPNGFLFLSEFGNALGLNFFTFRMIICTIALFLVYSTVIHYSPEPNVVLSIYLSSSFFLDTVQFRFFLASSIAFWSLRFLVEDNKVDNNIMYLICIVLAATIHPVMIVYLMFFGVRLSIKWLRRMSIAISGLILFLLYTGIAQAAAPFLVGELRAERYFYSLSRIGFIPYALIALVPVLTSAYLLKNEVMRTKLLEREQNKHCIEIQAKWNVFVRSAAYCMLPILCTLILRPEEFFRPIRLIILIFIMPVSAIFARETIFQDTNKKNVLVAITLIWLLGSFLFCYRSYFESVLTNIFVNNILL